MHGELEQQPQRAWKWGYMYVHTCISVCLCYYWCAVVGVLICVVLWLLDYAYCICTHLFVCNTWYILYTSHPQSRMIRERGIRNIGKISCWRYHVLPLSVHYTITKAKCSVQSCYFTYLNRRKGYKHIYTSGQRFYCNILLHCGQIILVEKWKGVGFQY